LDLYLFHHLFVYDHLQFYSFAHITSKMILVSYSMNLAHEGW